MAEIIKKIIKVGSLDNITKLYEQGEIFCSTMKYFKDCEKPDARFDKLEGSTEINQFTTLTIYNNETEIVFSKINSPKTVPLNKGFLSKFDSKIKGNLFCCTAITDENENYFIDSKLGAYKIDEKFLEFGDTMLIINNPTYFISAMQKEIRNLGFMNSESLVDYYNPIIDNMKLSVFKKDKKYEYQQELRFYIEREDDNPIKFNIGSLKDFSQLIKLK